MFSRLRVEHSRVSASAGTGWEASSQIHSLKLQKQDYVKEFQIKAMRARIRQGKIEMINSAVQLISNLITFQYF